MPKMASKRKHSSQSESPLKAKRSRGGESQSDEENTDVNMSQQPDFRPPAAATGEEAEVGIIEHVSLKNFMCHGKLEFRFCPNVNFIIGRNGSGKSAILTGIVVGLGGKASATNRGTSTKGFVKTGKQSSEVTVKLRNRGPDAYRHDVYGDSIIVERKLLAEGGSNYKLKSATGRVVSQKRDELAHILDQFNIQVENPVAILNQDTSRNFLHSKSEKDKYRFFLKATQLEQMKFDYGQANESKETAIEILKFKKETLPVLLKEVHEWEQKFKQLSSLDDLKKKIQHLKNEMAWAFVAEKEKELEPKAKALHKEEERLPKFEEKVAEADGKVKDCVEVHKDVQEKLKSLGAEVKELEPQHTTAKKSRDEKKKIHRDSQLELRRRTNDLASIAKDKDEIQQRIEELKSSAQHDYQSERKKREERIQQLKKHKTELEATQASTQQQLDQFRAAVSRYKEDEYNLRRDETDRKFNFDQAKRNLANLQKNKSNALIRFGHHMPNLMSSIEDACRRGLFHKKPIGPIGACLKVKDQSLALALECCLGGLIHSFCVTDFHDEKELEKIFKRVVPKGTRAPSIITSNFLDRVYDISRNKVQSKEHPCVLDLLKVDNVVVTNTLIDQRSVESIIIIRDESIAKDLMAYNAPKNCKEAFLPSGDQILKHPVFRYYSSFKERPQFLTADVEEEIRHRQEEVHKAQTEMTQLQEQLRTIKTGITKNQQEERSCQTRINKIRDKVGQTTMELTELQNMEDPVPVDVSTLEEEVSGLDEQMAVIQEEKNAAQQSYDEAKAELDTADKAFRDVDHRIRHVADSSEPFKEQLAAAENNIEREKVHKKHYEQKLKDQQKRITDSKKDHEKCKEELERDTKKADQICERINTRRTSQNIASEITQIERRIQAEEKTRGDPVEITRKYKETKDTYMKINKDVTQLENFLKNLGKVMSYRKEQFNQFRRMIALRTKIYFTVLLTNRNYQGKIVFNHQQETLVLSVQPTSSNGEGAKDMRSLSGGERSFATVCFILALWDAMESPFRCLDEFDVFMDMVNRRISMDMMMDVATKQKGRQFIFLTPQDMSQLKVSKDLRIYRMPDPERGQPSITQVLGGRGGRGGRNDDEPDE